jgi:hypothetical protein
MQSLLPPNSLALRALPSIDLGHHVERLVFPNRAQEYAYHKNRSAFLLPPYIDPLAEVERE